MITEYYKLSGIDKVAVLFSVIGESVAVRLLKTLSESDIRRIRARSREMDSVSVSLKKQILDEFYLAVMSQKLKNEGETEILLTGGGIIPKEDMEKLELLGVGKLFGPGSSVKESLSYIESWFKENKKDI